MIFRLVCMCGASARAEVRDSVPGPYSPLAVALHKAAIMGWQYRDGRIGKSVIDVTCTRCRRPLYLDGDVAPHEAAPTDDFGNNP